MIVRLTASCNNRCFFCLVDNEIARHAFRPLAEITAEIDRVPPDEEIDIFGGEPTIDPSFWNVLEYALRGGRRVTLASNVRLFAHAPSAERLRAVGGDRLIVRTSLMGHTPELHDRLNGVSGFAFSQTVQGIRNLTHIGFDVQTNIVVMAENIEHLLATALVAVDAGSLQVKFSGLIRTAAFPASVPDPDLVRSRLQTLVPLLRALGVTVSLEKFSPCTVPTFLEILSREADPASDVGSWYRQTPACRRCSLVTNCPGAERGALARYGEAWVQPIPSIPDNLVEDVPVDLLGTYAPRKDKPFVRVLFDPTDEMLIDGALSSIATFSMRHPQIHLIA